MFLAFREIRAAGGRFGLITVVVGLISLLLIMLTGLTGGLAKQNTSALEALNPDRYALAPVEDEISFTTSQITQSQVSGWQDHADEVAPLGTGQTLMETADSAGSVAVLGLPAGTELPGGGTVPERGGVASESLVEDQSLPLPATFGGIDVELVDSTADDYFSHSTVVWVSTETWQEITRVPDDVVGTALALGGSLDDEQWDAAAAETGTEAVTVSDSFNALPAYASEMGSLNMMQGFLYLISALVTVAFLTIWTIQRTRDLAVLRALGASTRYIMGDAVGQAAVILAVGVGAGAIIGTGLGMAVGGVVPFNLTVATVAVPAIGIWLLGMAGALIATRPITRIDPLTALGATA